MLDQGQPADGPLPDPQQGVPHPAAEEDAGAEDEGLSKCVSQGVDQHNATCCRPPGPSKKEL